MTTELFLTISLLLSFSVAASAVPKVIRVSHGLKLFDQPNARSAAKHVVPTLGGVAIFLGFIFGITLTNQTMVLPNIRYLVAGVIMMLFIGLKDDILNISPIKKLSAQLMAASILIFLAGFRFTTLHGFLGIYEIPYMVSVALTMFVIIVLINAFNLIDGIDGLAAGVSMLITLVLGGWFYLSGNPEFAIIAASLFGALAGFFGFNVFGHRNKIFMGDTGSLVIGLIMAVLVINFNELNAIPNMPYAIQSAPAVSFGILIYPLLDTIRVFSIRILQHRSPFSPDKNHVHHRLLALGFSHKQATFTIITINALFIVPVFALQHLGVLGLMVYILLTSGLLVIIPALIIKKRHLIAKDDPNQQIIFITAKLFSKFLRAEKSLSHTEIHPGVQHEIHPSPPRRRIQQFKNQLEKISLW